MLLKWLKSKEHEVIYWWGCPQMLHRKHHRLVFTGTCAEMDAAFLCKLMLCASVFMCRSEALGNVAMQVTLRSSLLSWDIQYDPKRRLTRRILAHCGLISGWQLDYVHMQKTSISTARQIQLNNCLTSLPSWRIECVSPTFPFSLFRFIALAWEKSSCGNCISAS